MNTICTNNQFRLLKQRLKSLEIHLQKLTEEKTEYLNKIDEFNRLYIIKFGDITQKILLLKEEIVLNHLKETERQYKEVQKITDTISKNIKTLKAKIRKLKKIIKETTKKGRYYKSLIDEYNKLVEQLEILEKNLLDKEEDNLLYFDAKFEDDKMRQRFAQIKSDFDSFKTECHNYDTKNTIDKNQQKELKDIWKQASKLCHPDIVADELSIEANELMQSLNEAYSQNDLKKVKEIYNHIKNGTKFVTLSESINDIDILKVKIEQLEQKILIEQNDIKELKQDDTFITINNINDTDKYFKTIRKQLEEQYEYIKKNRVF